MCVRVCVSADPVKVIRLECVHIDKLQCAPQDKPEPTLQDGVQ